MTPIKGNLSQSAAQIGPWVMGLKSLNPGLEPHLQNESFGLKWSNAQKGEKKEIATANSASKTIGILIRGKFRVTFPDRDETIILDQEGDYVFMPEDSKHTWEFLEDSLMISLRWPPLDDQY